MTLTIGPRDGLTIAQALEKLKPGDTLIVIGGTYAA